MARILVLYYSSYGHIAQMADAVAEGVRGAGHECDVRRVPETAPPEVAKAAGFVADQSHELISGIDALPQYDGGQGLNVTIMLFPPGFALDYSRIPILHWHAGLFGRGTTNLVLRNQLSSALAALDHELQVVGDIQRSLLPPRLPKIPGFELAAHYVTSARAGGDYYDFFPLPGDRWGLFIADVSGHGTPAAVLMAITHALAQPVMPVREQHAAHGGIAHLSRTVLPCRLAGPRLPGAAGKRSRDWTSRGGASPRSFTRRGDGNYEAGGAARSISARRCRAELRCGSARPSSSRRAPPSWPAR